MTMFAPFPPFPLPRLLTVIGDSWIALPHCSPLNTLRRGRVYNKTVLDTWKKRETATGPYKVGLENNIWATS